MRADVSTAGVSFEVDAILGSLGRGGLIVEGVIADNGATRFVAGSVRCGAD